MTLLTCQSESSRGYSTLLSREMMSSVLRLVLKCKVLSLFNLFRMYSQALFTGIAVKSDTTSNETVTSSSEISSEISHFFGEL